MLENNRLRDRCAELEAAGRGDLARTQALVQQQQRVLERLRHEEACLRQNIKSLKIEKVVLVRMVDEEILKVEERKRLLENEVLQLDKEKKELIKEKEKLNVELVWMEYKKMRLEGKKGKFYNRKLKEWEWRVESMKKELDVVKNFEEVLLEKEKYKKEMEAMQTILHRAQRSAERCSNELQKTERALRGHRDAVKNLEAVVAAFDASNEGSSLSQQELRFGFLLKEALGDGVSQLLLSFLLIGFRSCALDLLSDSWEAAAKLYLPPGHWKPKNADKWPRRIRDLRRVLHDTRACWVHGKYTLVGKESDSLVRVYKPIAQGFTDLHWSANLEQFEWEVRDCKRKWSGGEWTGDW